MIYPFDTTPFVKKALEEVVKTLIEAIIIVVGVMYLFLQNWRATIIPTIAVPVVLLGTFAVLGILGYSINMLTMFGLVLAIGLLVDDAIVVVENVERVMSEEGADPRSATIKSHGPDSGGPDRYRHGAFGRVYSDGLFRRFHRRDLPSVLRDDRLLDGAFSHCGSDFDARALRLDAQAGEGRSTP